ncbi:mucin-12-like isoform X2 [Xyrauchen texanus]|uniref:mucin-12-like isoform X2 n=1 Tax=Xyrauchen texanus TaxID=154827 RepID=UPI002242205C|nr:mucin-12-like isoform X2 [Xyrauchen texanus]
MGVLTLKLLVYGQLIWFILAINNITHPDQTTESPSWLNNTSQMKPTLMAPPLNGTGNYTENNASNSSSNSMYNTSDATLTNLTTQVTTTGPQNTTLGPIHSNATVTGTTVQPNTTANAQTNSTQLTSKPKTTVNITSTAVTSLDNITHSGNESTTIKTSPVPKPTENAPTTVIQNNTTLFHVSQGAGMNHSEMSMTILFSILLGVIVLIILVHFVYKSGRSNQSRIQYTHRRLQNEDTGEPFTVPEDTLVISGGLYDGPHIYNPTMTVQNEDEFQTDATGLAYRPTQFQLELLVEDQGSALDRDTLTFQTFQANDQEP